MNRANISYTRNHLSEMLARVREGETILIVDRQKPVARLEPVAGASAKGSGWQAELVRSGLVRRGGSRLSPRAFAAMPLSACRGKGDILEALLVEREEGR